MSASQRRKGAVGEREAAAALHCAGLSVTRQARNGVDHGCDLAGKGIVVEVKRRAGSLLMDTWMRQAIASKIDSDDIAIVACRSDRGEWLVCIRAQDFGRAARLRDEHRCMQTLDAIHAHT